MACRVLITLGFLSWVQAWLPPSYSSRTGRWQSARPVQQKPPVEDKVESPLRSPESPKNTEKVSLDPLGVPLGPYETAGLLYEKALDTLEDVALITKRQVSEIAWVVASQAQKQGVDTQPLLDRLRPKPKGGVPTPGALDAWHDPLDTRPRLLVLGTGWGAHALVKVIDSEKFRVLVVSPRNFFVFTPMLAASSVGTVEYRSITDPIRASNPTISLLEGEATQVDPVMQRVTVQPFLGAPPAWQTDDDSSSSSSRSIISDSGSANHHGHRHHNGAPPVVELEYDTLVYACGVQASGFGVKGVLEHCYFLKEVDDARAIRRACGDALERALAPSVSDDRRRAALTFVVVGGGPTGVEFAGELSDFLKDTVRRFYPSLENLCRVMLVHSGSQVLPQFDDKLRTVAQASLLARGVEVVTNTRAVEVRDGSVDLQAKDKGANKVTVPCGMTVWTGGTEPRPLTSQLLDALSKGGGESQEQRAAEPGKLPIDSYLRVVGPSAMQPGSLLAIGDAAAILEDSVADKGKNKPKLLAHRRTMDFGSHRDGEKSSSSSTSTSVASKGSGSAAPSSSSPKEQRQQQQPRRAPLPATAQVAAQQGAYAARLLNRGYNLTVSPKPKFTKTTNPVLPLVRGVQAQPFKFLNLGLLAYIGGGEAISQVQVGDQRLFEEAGSVGFLLWRSVYLAKQVSLRNRVLVLFDWGKSKFFGRDVTRL